MKSCQTIALNARSLADHARRARAGRRLGREGYPRVLPIDAVEEAELQTFLILP
ncbi:MAG: hypothetical protein V3U44_11590 [Alphaproteobacteria bacterium]